MLFDLAALLAVPVTSPANTVAELLDYGKKEDGRTAVRLSRRRHPLASAGGQDRRRHQDTDAVRALSRRRPDDGRSRHRARRFCARLLYGCRGFPIEKKLKALAVDAAARLSVMPDVPTPDGANLGQAKVASWFALAAPAGTPAPIVQKLRDEFIKASRDPELKRR